MNDFDLDVAINNFFGGGAEEEPKPVAAAPAKPAAAPPKAVATPPPSVSQVQERLDMAVCYQTLMAGGFFEDTETNRAAAAVEVEIRQFAQQRLETLLGMSQNKNAPATAVKAQFSETEALVLRRLVEEVIARYKKKGEKAAHPAPPPPEKPSAVLASPRPALKKRGRPKKEAPPDSASEPPPQEAVAPAPRKTKSGQVPPPPGLNPLPMPSFAQQMQKASIESEQNFQAFARGQNLVSNQNPMYGG